MRRLLVLCVLLFATALSGPASASLRAIETGANAVICADGVAVMVTLDADGQPVPPGQHRRHCADCLPLVVAAVGTEAGPPISLARVHAVATSWPTAFAHPIIRRGTLRLTRGPPGGGTT